MLLGLWSRNPKERWERIDALDWPKDRNRMSEYVAQRKGLSLIDCETRIPYLSSLYSEHKSTNKSLIAQSQSNRSGMGIKGRMPCNQLGLHGKVQAR
jgi:hypothetical protein